MRKNPVKAALKAGKPQVGTWLSLGDLTATRILARAGFPWLTVDMEHSPIDWKQAAALFGAIADAGCIPLCRVPEGRHENIKRALDSGAYGIVAPMVNTVEQAKMIIAAAKYPPVGNRSIGGTLPSVNFDCTSGEYFKHANNEILVILQTESPQGVDNAEAIYSLPGVDAIFVGPNDLTAQMRGPDGVDPTPDQLEAMLQRILAAGKKVGTPVGIHCMSIESVQQRIREGWQFLAMGSELRAMTQSAQQWLTALDMKPAKGELARY
jgi:4-hydroxy-2-oxoheptanedioate aldolase